MWKLKNIEAENLCAFRHLSYTLQQGVTTLIFGDNRDNESQQSNGAGKSALLECIAVGITGSPLRKIRSEEIINDAAEECRIELRLTNDFSGEELSVARRIPRKGASTVACMLWRDGKEAETDEAVQPSVDAYNWYILDKLGITRDELLNNFILSKYRYADFLSSSDKEKKEIINRFSNGILVDEAIARVEEDIDPLSDEQQRINLELAGIDGRIGMLQEQIDRETAAREERGRTREARIAELEAAIAAKREQIRVHKEEMAGIGSAMEKVRQADEALQELESSDTPLEECLKAIETFMPLFPDARRTDWNRAVRLKKENMEVARASLTNLDAAVKQAEETLAKKHTAWERFKADYAGFRSLYKDKTADFQSRLLDIDKQLRDLAGRLDDLRRKRRTISAGIDELSNKLAGKIACPACGHEFLVAHPGFDIEAGTKDLRMRQQQLSEINGRIEAGERQTEEVEMRQSRIRTESRTLESDRHGWEQRLSEHERAVRGATDKVESAEHQRKRTHAEIAALQDEVDGIRRKVFDEVFGFIDERNAALGREKRKTEEDIRAAVCAVETLQDTIREVNEATTTDLPRSLRATMQQEKQRSMETARRKFEVDDRVRDLEVQRERFVQFKTYLANTKIEALSRITNEFLIAIGSDIRIRFDGYTVLKSGKVREKISISLLRDGVDCGSFGKFSAGEAARVNLATILAMQKLVNANCDDGKGLDLLVLDEILEAVDEAGLASMFEALNALGGTVLVVSHGNVAEGYPHKLVITKEHGESRIGE
ncbi:SMC family ATPase [Bacteroides caccae]|uniref:SMC family ATPase n=1 Tax=Bacteroides caccae TaxID=47678 RepID=A0AAW7WLG9_9BACE|nr:AAA family ATPase [Bacteroides caccae]MDO6328077.1 SMC family ATPase [Bacteroides caccae]MDO6340347.1 SMC family ATPase [Bacteroides caccae]MDO6357488.1 SMC family ATPase [Bacteroides caccae]